MTRLTRNIRNNGAVPVDDGFILISLDDARTTETWTLYDMLTGERVREVMRQKYYPAVLQLSDTYLVRHKTVLNRHTLEVTHTMPDVPLVTLNPNTVFACHRGEMHRNMHQVILEVRDDDEEA